MNLNEVVTDIYKRDIKQSNGELLTIKDVFLLSLMKSDYGKENPSDDLFRYNLAKKIRDNSEEIELNKEEMEIIMNCVYQQSPIEVFGFISDWLKALED